MNMQAGWLDDVTGWIKRQLEALWSAFVQFWTDMWLATAEFFLDMFATVIEMIPVPDFLANGLGSMFGNLDPAVLYFVDIFGVAEGCAFIGAGVAFRLTRKLLTLGQW